MGPFRKTLRTACNPKPKIRLASLLAKAKKATKTERKETLQKETTVSALWAFQNVHLKQTSMCCTHEMGFYHFSIFAFGFTTLFPVSFFLVFQERYSLLKFALFQDPKKSYSLRVDAFQRGK